MLPIRLLDLGSVPALSSQAVYHGVAYAFGPASPDTIVLVSPATPYLCVGFHQDLTREVDVDRCRQAGLPIYRREVGGGAVYLDGEQVFVQWIFAPRRLPASLEDRFALYVAPLVATYRSLGIPASHRPVNDVHVNGRKIGGTGAAQIGDAEVVVGSLMFDFDADLMARVLKVPSEKMRDKIHQSLREYITTMTRELGHRPDAAAVKGAYVRFAAAALGRPVQPGALSEAEVAAAREVESRFASDAWTHQTGALRPLAGVKIHEDVQVVESAHKAPGGLVRAVVRLRAGQVDDLALSGDFTLRPRAALEALERALRGAPFDAGVLRARVARIYQELAVEAPGVGIDDWVAALIAARAPNPPLP